MGSMKGSKGGRKGLEDAGQGAAGFSLAEQNERRLKKEGELPSSDKDDEEAAFQPSGDGPQEFKTNYGRRRTQAVNKLLASDSAELLGARSRDGRSSVDQDSASRAASGVNDVDEDTDEGDGDEAEIDLFDAFKFKSFRRQKQEEAIMSDN